MQLQDFDYFLPSELIAQEPTVERSASRLMTVERTSRTIRETRFAAIGDMFRDGDLLVINDTRVIPARLIGVKESGGRVEVFLVRRVDQPGEVWRCLLRSSKSPRSGSIIFLPQGMTAILDERGEGESWTVRFTPTEEFSTWLERTGQMPLPPYIKRQPEDIDRERYQTVFARVKGAVAAPTAGLHFTPELLSELESRGVEVVPLTLHVGLGTFMPIRCNDVREHRMHREYYQIPSATASAVNARKSKGGRVIAVGTTAARALEQAAGPDGTVPAGEGEADIFIYPGYAFKVVDGLITNFHLPKSTLLMLVSAFAGKDLLFRAYAEAVSRRFRFFSYGDAMLIL